MSKTFSTMLKMMLLDMLSSADELLAGMGGEMGKLMEVIITDRNQVVVDDLSRLLRDEPQVKSVGIIYGAGHLSDLEKRLTADLGFQEAGARWFTAISVNVRDAGMTAAEARQARETVRDLMQQQIKAMKRAR